MSAGPDDREPLSERELGWITIELTAGMAVWIVGANTLLDGSPRWLTDVVSYGGGVCVAMGIGWWRIIRYGPEGPPRSSRGRMMRWGATTAGDATGAGLLIGGTGATVMCIVLLAESSNDDDALEWGIAFGGLAVVQLANYLRRRLR